jgi:nucleotide-binding universal stress UspA family protein
MTRILVPVNASDASMRGVRAALALYGELPSVEIHLLHVEVADGVPAGALGESEYARDGSEMAQRTLDAAQDVVTRAGVACVGEIRKGYVPAVIAEYARATRCAAIVMVTRGMGSTGEVIDSIARQVVSLADVPVTLVK